MKCYQPPLRQTVQQVLHNERPTASLAAFPNEAALEAESQRHSPTV